MVSVFILEGERGGERRRRKDREGGGRERKEEREERAGRGERELVPHEAEVYPE